MYRELINLNKKWISKILWVFFIILLIIILGSLYYLVFVKPSQNESNTYWVTIKGKVVPSPNLEIFDSKPSTVTAYYPNFKSLCEAVSIEPTYIRWENDTNEGEYQISFQLTAPMEITLATHCTVCNPTKIFVDPVNNFIEKKVIYGDKKCYEEIDFYTDLEKAISRAQYLIGYTFEDLINKNDLTQDKIKDVKKSIDFGQRELNDMDKTNSNSSLLSAHKSIFYAWQASYKMDLLDVETCINNIQMSTFGKNSTCYKISSNDARKLESIKRSHDSFSSVAKKEYLETEDIEEVKSMISWVFNNRRALRGVERECKDTLDSVSSHLDNQKIYCEKRDILLETLPWEIIAFAFILGSLIGRWVKEKS